MIDVQLDTTNFVDGKTAYFDGTAGVLKTAWASPQSPIADLRDFMDARYGAGQWTYRTTQQGSVVTGTDAGPAITDALAALRARYGRGKLLIPPGAFTVIQPPDPQTLGGHIIEGFGSQASQIYFQNGQQPLFWFNGSATGGALKGLGLLIEAGLGDTNATCILQQGNVKRLDANGVWDGQYHQPDQMEFSDLYITSADGVSKWHTGWLVNGEGRTSPQGVRVCHATNIQIFRCRYLGAGFYNAQKFSVINLGIYAGTGTGNSLYLSGGGTSSKNSGDCLFDNITVSGDLNLTAATGCSIRGKCSTVSASSSFNAYDIFLDSGAPLSGSLGPNGRYVII